MTLHLDRRQLLIVGAAALIARPAFAASTHEIEMLNKHPEDKKERMVFAPNLAVLETGDSVKFLASTKGHNSETIKGMFPDGKGWKGKINEEIEITFDTPGFYGYKCTPHFGTGMVGLIVVKGDSMHDNLEAVQGVKQRGKAKKRFEAIWEEAANQGLLPS